VLLFKEDITTELDKRFFKRLCDRWCVVLEHPTGSGVKCLQLKNRLLDDLAATDGT
jgi:hypothetical protein